MYTIFIFFMNITCIYPKVSLFIFTNKRHYAFNIKTL